MKVEGTVDNIFSKTKDTRSGKQVTIFYAEVGGWTINMGFKPIWEEGEYVSVNVEEKYGELQVSKGGPKVSASPSMGKSSSGTTKGGSYGAKGKFPVEPTDSQVSIIRQSSLNRAVESVNTLMEQGIIKLVDMDEYENTVFELAYKYTDFGTGQREVKKAKHDEVKRAALEAVNG